MAIDIEGLLESASTVVPVVGASTIGVITPVIRVVLPFSTNTTPPSSPDLF